MSFKNCYECPFAINFNCIHRRQKVLRWRRSRQQKRKTKTRKKLKGFVETKMQEWNFLSSLNSNCKYTVVCFVVQRKKRGKFRFIGTLSKRPTGFLGVLLRCHDSAFEPNETHSLLPKEEVGFTIWKRKFQNKHIIKIYDQTKAIKLSSHGRANTCYSYFKIPLKRRCNQQKAIWAVQSTEGQTKPTNQCALRLKRHIYIV